MTIFAAGIIRTRCKRARAVDNIESLTILIQEYIVKTEEIFNYLNQKGIVNTGKCPYTGQLIDSSFPKWTYKGTRKIYLSHEGYKIMQMEDNERFTELTGKTPPAIKESKGCYIATVCYSNEFAPEVVKLKKYRDAILKTSWYGRLFIRFYYWFSPSAAKFLQNKTKVNSFIRTKFLDKIVEKL